MSDRPLIGLPGIQAESVGLSRFAHQLAYARHRPGLLAPRRRLRLPALCLSGEHDSLCPPARSDDIVALVEPPHPAVHHCLGLPLPAKNRWTFLSPSSTVRNGTTAPDQAHVSSS